MRSQRRELDIATLWKWFDLRAAWPGVYTDHRKVAERVLVANKAKAPSGIAPAWTLGEPLVAHFATLIDAGGEKPLPAEFDGVARDRIRTFLPRNNARGEKKRSIQDPEAAFGTAAVVGGSLFLLPEINAFYNTPRLAPADFAAWAARQDYLTLHPDPQYHTGRVGFSGDIRRGVFSAQTVIFEALQVAAFLGYRQIFILGMDLNAGPGQARFYEQGDHVARTRLGHRPVFAVFELV